MRSSACAASALILALAGALPARAQADSGITLRIAPYQGDTIRCVLSLDMLATSGIASESLIPMSTARMTITVHERWAVVSRDDSGTTINYHIDSIGFHADSQPMMPEG